MFATSLNVCIVLSPVEKFLNCIKLTHGLQLDCGLTMSDDIYFDL